MTKNGDEDRSNAGRGRFWLVYLLWILFCGALFTALQGAPDPALPDGRLEEKQAILIAEAILRGRQELAAHQLVHAAFSPNGELGDESRWIILFSPQAGRLQNAVVVELSGREGRLIRMRRLPN